MSEEKKGQTIHEMASYVFNEAIKRANADQFDEAIGVYGNLTDLAPAISAAFSQRGRCHWEMHRWYQAKRDFEKAVQLDPDNADVSWTLGLMNLQLCRFTDGWRDYETRWGSKVFKSPRLRTSKPQWKLGDGNKKVLVWCEQGLGDQIIYSSLLNKLSEYVDEVTVMLDMRLIKLLERGHANNPKIKFLPHDARVDMDAHDSHLPIASLGSCFIHDLPSIERFRSENYLLPDWRRTAQLKRDLSIKDGELVIGLSWTSTAPSAVGKHKSCSLKDLEPLLKEGMANGYRFVSLQYGDVGPELDQYPQIIRADQVDKFFDVEGVASLMMLCDRIVSVSNVNVHIAGAMGKPVHLLDANKLWYWNNRVGNHNLWYPTVKIYPRANMLAPWDEPVKKVVSDLFGNHDDKLIEEIDTGYMFPTFVFFHVGDDVYMPQKMVSSIRSSNPNATIIMCTDATTPEVLGINKRHEYTADRNRLMVSRLAGFASLNLDHPAIYLDTDMLIGAEINPKEILGDKDAVFCRRSFDREYGFNTGLRGLNFSEYEGKTLDEVYPFIACATVTRNARPWVAMLELLSFLDPKYHIWYGDQEASKLYASTNPTKVAAFTEAEYGCLPERIDPNNPPKIVHFKGEARKKLFEAA